MNQRKAYAVECDELTGKTDGPARIRVMDVEYVHLSLPDGDELYLTEYGLPFARQLLPQNFWTDEAWLRGHCERLSGSSTLYRIRTKHVGGKHKDIVLKWNRMGQDVPGTTQAEDLATAEFNSPFEEFSLAIELRKARDMADVDGADGAEIAAGTGAEPGAGEDAPVAGDGSAPRVLTHKPLAIYVPHKRVALERLGRRAHKFEAKRDAHEEIELDPHRKYAVIYEWLKGIDAVEAYRRGVLDADTMGRLVDRVRREMARKGFRVRDNKAQHIIVRPDGRSGVVRHRDGRTLYATIDFELLERTPRREQAVRARKRRAYLVKQAHRFEAKSRFPSHLAAVRIFGVDYVYGHIESTGGALWVVGRDPDLFDYFLPEKWRKTARRKLSNASVVYETITKDNVRLVWRVSRVGEQPDMDPFKDDERRILAYGYNSPFEEVALALELTARGIETTYPRAIYMTGETTAMSDELGDGRRYDSHAPLRMPDGRSALQPNHDYILIWGYWNAPDEILAVRDEDLYTGINALNACRQGVLAEETYLHLMQAMRGRLLDVGIEDMNLRGNHLLLSLDRGEKLVMARDGLPAVRICNFELLRRIGRP
jgi:hypothetical protein